MKNLRILGLALMALVLCFSTSCSKDEIEDTPTESCSDGILNQDETAIDCGGVCDPCPIPNCFDGIQNQNETGVDCGGVCVLCEETSDCLESISGDCAALSNHPTLLFLAENSCQSYCIMKQFVEDCPVSVNISGNILSPEEYLEYFFLTDTDIRDSINSASAMVHEAAHHLTYNVAGFSNTHIVFDCENSLTLSRTNTFPSKDLVPLISEDYQSFRFETYVNSTSSINSTQQHGIYGLLNEFAAYYHGSVTKFDFEPFGYPNFNGLSFSTMSAYYEFKYYILLYLIYAETNEVTIYNNIMANDDFITAFNTINNRYEAMVNNYLDLGYYIHFDSNDPIYNIIDILQTTEYTDMLAKLQ